ncbi:MAG: hypothetical protein ACKO2Q_06100, partial [Actinomycetota bacterium]
MLSFTLAFGELLGKQTPTANASQAANCQIGSSSSCPATSPQEIVNIYGAATNGQYWLNVAGTPRHVYVKMDTSAASAGGYWILLMKGNRGT